MSGSPFENLRWRKSRRSHYEQNCVEVALTDRGAAVRDSKAPKGSGILAFSAEAWRAFIEGIKAGELDHPTPTDTVTGDRGGR